MNYEKNFDSPSIFKEEQKFNTPLFYLPIIISSIFFWVMFILQIFFKKQIGKNPAPDLVIFLLFITFGLIFPLLMLNMKLTTEIKYKGIFLKFFPFHLKGKFFPFEEIEKVELLKYNPIKDYGGWGIRYGKSGWAYNVRGKIGLMVYFKNGKKILIGTQKGEEIINVISPYVNCRNLLIT